MIKIGLGGGCHWCTEGVFVSLKGVTEVEQGWIGSKGEYDQLSEAVIVHFDSDVVSLRTLMEIHLLTHSSASNHSMRGKYRSAVYSFSDQQQREAEAILKKLETESDERIITAVLPFATFKKNSEQFLDYYRKNPQNAFCTRYIQPKLERLMQSHAENIKSSS